MSGYIKAKGLIGTDGKLSFVGCSDTLKYLYSRMNVSAPDIMIKESDSYTVIGDNCSLKLTSADYGFRSFISAEYTNDGKHIYKELSLPFTLGSRAPADTGCAGETKQLIRDSAVSFVRDADGGVLMRCVFPEFDIDKTLSAEIHLKGGGLFCASEPFEYGRQKFYYCENNIGMTADGIIRLGNTEYHIEGGIGISECVRCVAPSGFRRVKAVGYNNCVSLILSDGGTYEEARYENALFINGKAYYLTAGDTEAMLNGCEYTGFTSDKNKAGIVFKAACKPFRNNSGIFGYTEAVSGTFDISFMNENYNLNGFIRKSFIRF